MCARKRASVRLRLRAEGAVLDGTVVCVRGVGCTFTEPQQHTARTQAGFKRMAEAAVAKVPALEPQQVADMVVGFHK